MTAVGRTYVVTGAMSGIGEATSRKLIERGHRVVGVDITDGVDVQLDLGGSDAAARLSRALSARGVKVIDAVIACAGVVYPRFTPERVVGVNYFGVIATLEATRDLLRRSGSPRVAVVSSFAATMPAQPELLEALAVGDRDRAAELADAAGAAVYATSKRALNHWVRRTAVTPDWAGAGIVLNAVAPGTVATPMMAAALSDPARRQVVDRLVPMPLGHCEPADIAEALAWLTSAENRRITGQVIFVDGGAQAVAGVRDS